MFSSVPDARGAILNFLAQKINEAFDLRKGVSLSYVESDLKIVFANADDFFSTVDIIQKSENIPKNFSISFTAYSITLKPQAIESFFNLVLTNVNKLVSTNADSASEVLYVHKKRKYSSSFPEEEKSLIIDKLPFELFCKIIEFLDRDSAYSFALCLVLSNQFNSKKSLDKGLWFVSETRQLLRDLFKSHQDVQQSKLAANCYIPNQGLYVWGYNNTGNLGLGHKNKVTFQFHDFFKGKKIKKAAIGSEHALYLTESGEVYACGQNKSGQLGLGYSSDCITTPQLMMVSRNNRIVDIAVGNSHSIFLTKDGQVYTCGNNEYGQLGLTEKLNQSTPRLIYLSDKKINKVSAGEYHSLFLTQDKKVYVCGKNMYGQLGLNHTENVFIPEVILHFVDKKIIDCSAGSHFSLFLVEEHEVYSCGWGSQGQLGIGEVKQPHYILSPQLIPSLLDKQIIKIIAGRDLSLFLTADNKVYSCGQTYFGEIARKSTSTSPHNVPGLVETLSNSKIVEISAEDSMSCFLTSDGNFYFSGRNFFDKEFESTDLPVMVNIPKPHTKEELADKDMSVEKNQFEGQWL